VYNNVFDGIKQTAFSNHRDVEMYSNIFYNVTQKNLGTGTGGDIHPFYVDYNAYFPNTQWTVNFSWGGNPITYSSLPDWQMGLGGCPGTGNDCNSLTLDPLFQDPANHDYHLRGNSPYLARGIDRQDHDSDGNTTERINLGAYITGVEIIGYSPRGRESMIGDLNNDHLVNVFDLQLCVNVILGTESNPEIVRRAQNVIEPKDTCNVLDVQEIVNLIING
jgi:hypothetical protein